MAPATCGFPARRSAGSCRRYGGAAVGARRLAGVEEEAHGDDLGPAAPVDAQAVHEAPARRHAAVEVAGPSRAGCRSAATRRASRAAASRAATARIAVGERRPTRANRCRRCWRRPRSARMDVAGSAGRSDRRSAGRSRGGRCAGRRGSCWPPHAAGASCHAACRRPARSTSRASRWCLAASPSPGLRPARERPDRARDPRSRASPSARCAPGSAPARVRCVTVAEQPRPGRPRVGRARRRRCAASATAGASPRALGSLGSAPRAGTRAPRRSSA